MKRLPRTACSRLENLTLGIYGLTRKRGKSEKERGRERERGERSVLGNDFERKSGEERKSSKRADSPSSQEGKPIV